MKDRATQSAMRKSKVIEPTLNINRSERYFGGFHFNQFGTLLGAPVSFCTTFEIRITLIYIYIYIYYIYILYIYIIYIYIYIYMIDILKHYTASPIIFKAYNCEARTRYSFHSN